MNDDLIFVTKQIGKHPTQNDVDVSVTFVEDGKSAAFSFSPKAMGMLGAGYLVAAQKLGKIYFKPSNMLEGFKLTGRIDCGRKMIRVSLSSLGITSSAWIGYYQLEWDEKRRLFYICIDRKGQDA